MWDVKWELDGVLSEVIGQLWVICRGTNSVFWKSGTLDGEMLSGDSFIKNYCH